LKPKIDVELELAEDEYDLNRTQQALLIQGQIVQEALASLKVEQERMKSQIDSMPKRLEDTIDQFLKTLPQAQLGQAASIGGGGWASAIPQIIQFLGGSNASNSLDQELQGVFQDQFKRTTLNLWKNAFRDLNRKMGISDHVVVSEASEGVHLTGT